MDIVVSNRVAKVTPDGPMMGGLASALLPAVRKSGVVWFGSSGKLRKAVPGTAPLVQLESYGRGTIATVDLPEQYYCGFYEGFANSALWPLLHSRPDLSRASAHDYAAYTEVNAYMARTLAAFGGSNSTFWIHDYHFLPLGAELRELGITREIGFFLHTPWPNRRMMGRLPQFRDLAQAMLAYDLIGFQTDRDRDNFAELLRTDLRLPGNGPDFPHASRRLPARDLPDRHRRGRIRSQRREVGRGRRGAAASRQPQRRQADHRRRPSRLLEGPDAAHPRLRPAADAASRSRP